MATTTNYGWTTPDDTALVKDGAAAIRSLGTAIDTSFAADEGDLLVGGTSDIFEALPIGAAGTVLTSDGDTAEWVAPAGGIVSGNNFVATAEDTTSDSFTDLTTSQAVTLTTGTKVLVLVGAVLGNTTTARGAAMSFAITGATSKSAAFETAAGSYEIPLTSTNNLFFSRHCYLTVTAGSNTFTAKFRRVFGGTATFEQRFLTVIDMGS
jgi:hypothetical protein